MSEKRIDAGELSERERELIERVDDKKEELIDLLSQLISIDSRTVDPSKYTNLEDIFMHVKHFMEACGATTQFINCPHDHDDPDKGKPWYNLLGWIGKREGGHILQFNGHLDVVPFEESKWKDGLHPLKPVVLNDRVYGRGAADMKGGLASQMMAFKILAESDIKMHGCLQMWFVPDEEINGDHGAQFMAKEHKEMVNAGGTVISEPTGQPPVISPAIILGEKGHKWLRFTMHGSSGHGSMPKPKSNAIQKATRFISSIKKLKLPKVKPPLTIWNMLRGVLSRFTLRQLIKAARSPGDDEPDPYNEDGIGISNFFKTTISFTGIKAGKKVNVIPDTCEFCVDIRVLPGVTTQDVFDSLARYCMKLGYRLELPEGYENIQEGNRKVRDRPVDMELEIISCTNGTFVEPDRSFTKMLAKAFEDVYRVRAVYFFAPGSTDAVHMREQGIQDVVVFGPTGSRTHDSNEYVEIEHLVKTCKVYLLLAYRMLCKDTKNVPDSPTL